MNSVFTFVLLLIAIVMCASVCNTYLKQRNSRSKDDDELDEAIARLNQLEDRIRVLERIVTEERTDLGREIEGL